MPKASPFKNSFNSGEWSPNLGAHINLEKYGDSALLINNMIALKQGPITRRGGTKFIKEVKYSSKNTALIDFIYSSDNVVQIEAGDGYFRFYKDYSPISETAKNITGATQANPVVITSAAHGYSNGDEIYIDDIVGMTELNNKYYLISNKTTNTYELHDIYGNDIDGTGYTAYTSGGKSYKTYEISSPFSESDIYDADYIKQFQSLQSNNVKFFVYDGEPFSLVRNSDTSWTINTIDFNDGPYLLENSTNTTLTLSGTTGSVTVTASSTTGINDGSGFLSTDVGRLIRWQDTAAEWTWLEITARSSTTVVTATIRGQNASAGTATKFWNLGVFSETTGYPTTISFDQDRVCLGGSKLYPERNYWTITAGYSPTDFYFDPSDVDGTVAADNSMDISCQSGALDNIVWSSQIYQGLLIGTTGGEWIATGSTTTGVRNPDNLSRTKISSVGSAYIQPVSVDTGIVFVQKARRKLHDIVYSYDYDQYKPRDLSIFSEHITASGICEIAYQQEPENVVWLRCTDGRLVGMTYYPDQNVWGFHRHELGGADVYVNSICTTPSSDGLRNELYCVVQRTIDSTIRQYVECMTRTYNSADMEKLDQRFFDSHMVLNNPVDITGATQANPVVITSAAHGLSTGDYIDINDISGMTELNGKQFKVTVLTANTFSLQNYKDVDIDGTGFSEYIYGGVFREATKTISGLDHLEGETLGVMLNGKWHPDVTVSDGSVTFTKYGSYIVIGLPFQWELKTQRIEAGAADGTAQGKTKRITNITVRVLDTRDMQYGADEDSTLDEVIFDGTVGYDKDVDLYSGDTKNLKFPNGYDTKGTIYLTGTKGFNSTILGIFPQIVTQDR